MEQVTVSDHSIYSQNKMDFISPTNMLKAKDGDFFISDWLRNRNTVEFLGIWEKVHNPNFNYGEYATIRNQAGLNSYKISVLYTAPGGGVKDEVILNDGTLWLTQQRMAELLNVGVPAISKHLKNIFESGELVEESVISILETTATEPGVAIPEDFPTPSEGVKQLQNKQKKLEQDK